MTGAVSVRDVNVSYLKYLLGLAHQIKIYLSLKFITIHAILQVVEQARGG